MVGACRCRKQWLRSSIGIIISNSAQYISDIFWMNARKYNSHSYNDDFSVQTTTRAWFMFDADSRVVLRRRVFMSVIIVEFYPTDYMRTFEAISIKCVHVSQDTDCNTGNMNIYYGYLLWHLRITWVQAPRWNVELFIELNGALLSFLFTPTFMILNFVTRTKPNDIVIDGFWSFASIVFEAIKIQRTSADDQNANHSNDFFNRGLVYQTRVSARVLAIFMRIDIAVPELQECPSPSSARSALV